MTLRWRSEVIQSDLQAIRDMVARVGVFSAEECDVAVELAENRLTYGTKSDYHFMLVCENPGAQRPNPLPLAGEGSGGVAAAGEGKLIGYTCYGRIPMTDARYDLYWIVVDASAQQRGIASALMEKTEAAIAALGGKMLFAETSSRAVYAPAHAFYRKHGMNELAHLKDFYADRDDKILFGKKL